MEFDFVIDCIVQEVLKKLENKEFEKKKSALVIVNGGTKNIDQILIELERIKKSYTVEVIFSEAGEKIIGVDRFKSFDIKRNLGLTDIDFLDEKDILILPLLTKNTCAKVAVGIRDNIVTYLISKYILTGKKIVAVYDSCIVENKNSYTSQLNSNIEKLKDYGIIFVESKELADYILDELDENVLDLRKKKIITLSDMIKKESKKILISKDTIVTTLAKDRAREEGIIFELEK